MHLTDNPPKEPNDKSDTELVLFDLLDLDVEASNFVLALANSFDSILISDGRGGIATTFVCCFSSIGFSLFLGTCNLELT